MPEDWMTVQEIVGELKVHEQTVRRWLRTGALRGALLGDKAGYRVRRADLDEFLAQRMDRDEGKGGSSEGDG